MLRHRFPLVSLHGFRQAQKFALEMVEGIFAVIQRPPISKRIFGIKQDGIQSAGDSEDPRQTNGSQRLESIGILNYFRSSVRGGIAALKLCASMAWLTAG